MIKNVLKICIVLFITVLILAAYGTAYCQESTQELKTCRGQVMEIDWVGSLLTVEGEDDITFYVPSGTKIVYGTDTVSLSELEQNDYVMVKYIDNPAGTPRAVHITVDKSYPID